MKKNFFYKIPIVLKNVDEKNVLVSNEISFHEKSYKYFIGYLYNDHKVKPSHIMLSTTSTYVKCYDGCAYVKSYDKTK